MFIERLKDKFGTNEPIFTNEILDLFTEYSRAYVFRLIKKAEETEELLNFCPGIYFIPTNNIVGTSTITAEDVVTKKYISNQKKVYGLYSGINLQNMFSCTTQVPNTIVIVSNNESTRRRAILIDGRQVILKKSRCEITSTNIHAYTILQLLSEIDDTTIFNEKIINTIMRYKKINKVNNDELIELAKFFPAKTTKKLLCSGVLNVFTQ